MENSFDKLDDVVGNIKEYINNRIALVKIEVAEKTSGVVSSIIAFFLVIFIFLLVVIFFSVALALGIGKITGENYWGFLIVSAIYLILGLTLWKAKDRIIRIPIMNSILRQLYKEEE